MLTLNVIKYCA